MTNCLIHFILNYDYFTNLILVQLNNILRQRLKIKKYYSTANITPSLKVPTSTILHTDISINQNVKKYRQNCQTYFL